MSKLTDSKTSKNSSFLLYLIFSLLQPIWPVTWLVIWACSSRVYKGNCVDKDLKLYCRGITHIVICWPEGSDSEVICHKLFTVYHPKVSQDKKFALGLENRLRPNSLSLYIQDLRYTVIWSLSLWLVNNLYLILYLCLDSLLCNEGLQNGCVCFLGVAIISNF